jgi:hypothetical protein
MLYARARLIRALDCFLEVEVMKLIVASMLLLTLLPVTSLGQQESFPEMLKLAREGKAWAQNEVGLMYSSGEGVRRNRKKAVYWLRKSAHQGVPLGACSLGYHYGHGWGVKKDKVLMVKWVLIGEFLDPLRCGSEGAKLLKPSECQVARGEELAVAWLKAHPKHKNNFGEQPWIKDDLKKFEDERKKKCGS